VSAVALHHEAAGAEDAPPLLLAGSLGTTLAVWEPQLAALSARLRVIRVDLRGHGGSPAPPGPYAIADLGADVLALLDGLGLERASWCGLSIGGMVGQWLAAHAPERIHRLVLLCTSAHLPPASAWAERAAAVRAAGSVEVVADAVVERWLTPPFAAAHPERRAWLRDMLVGCDPEGYAACCEAIAGMDLRPDLERIAAPTLVVGAEDDPATPPEHQRTIAATVPGARLELLPRAAHLASVERPEPVTRLVLDHLEPAPT
jgi:3-oxoadipate enol-lactonase